MPPKVKKESLVMIINIGMTSHIAEISSTSIEKKQQVAKRKIEKMIFLTPRDEVAIILMGSSNTKNSLDIEHVEEFANFQVPNWDVIEEVMALKSTQHCSNWVEALTVGIEFVKQNVIDSCTRKVILMSDFNEDENIISQFEADVIADSLSTEAIDLITISEESLEDRPEALLNPSKMLLKVILKKINGQHISFDNALSGLRFYVPAPTKPSPSYFTLELVDKKIPIVSYVKTNENKFPVWKKAKGIQKLERKTQYLDRQRNTYEKDEIVTGYEYGGVFIAVERELEEAMSYKSGVKSYRIYSFTDRNNINLEFLCKDQTHIILPSSAAKNVTKPFYSLVQAMHNTNKVAIVRKVFRTNAIPRMVALFPCIDIPDEPWCLVEIDLVFAEDRRVMETRTMKSVIKELTSEQNEAIDTLLNTLMLRDTQDSYEVDEIQYFLPGCVPDPVTQHRWHMLSHRALNPDEPLPPMEDYLNKFLEAPMIKERSKPCLQKISEIFRIESIDSKGQQKDQIRVDNNMHVDEAIDVKEYNKLEDKVDIENDSCKESVLSMDTSDIDLDELAANI